MPTLDGFDYSWARPSPTAMRAAGITVVARYLHDSPKGLTRPEADALHAAGIGIVLNYEALSGNHLLGAGQGAADGAEARRLATALGAPNLPIYFSCDREVSAGMIPTVLAYLNAADSAAHQSRCYAQFAVCEAFARPAWQTLAWSYGRMSTHAVLYQYAIDQTFQGSAVDFDTVLDRSQLGAWWPAGSSESADSGTAHEITPNEPASPVGDGMYEILRNTKSGAVRAAGPNYWVALEGRTAAETLTNITIARTGPLCHNPTVRDVSDPGMAWWKRFYTTGKVS